jgi:hypothetical protein
MSLNHAKIARFAAIRAIVPPVGAQPYAVQPLAEAAVAVTEAVGFRLIALHANHLLRHFPLPLTLYLTRQVATSGK